MQTALWNIPYPRNLHFTGRGPILIQLQTLLQRQKVAQPLALSGLGGIGKTQTAVEYAYRYRDAYDAVFWIRADTRDTLTSDYLAIAAQLKLSEGSDQDQIQIIAAMKYWLQTHRAWLLILDNADDLKLVAEFLPVAGAGHIILTTRASTMEGIARKIDLEKLEPAEGALFLLRRTSILAQNAPLSSADSVELARAEEISRIMDGLPLALDQAGAYIEEREYGLSTYLSLYKKRRNELLKERGGSNPDHPASVATTLFLSFRNVEQASPAAADLLRFCAFLAPDAIPEELLLEPDGWIDTDLDAIEDELRKAMGILQRYSLLQRATANDKQPTFSLHRLVQIVLRDDMDEHAQRHWIERIAQLLNRVFLFDYRNLATWTRCERLLSHVLVCIEHCKQWEMYSYDFLELCKSVLAYLHHLVRDVEAESLAQQIYDIDRSIFAPEGQDHAIVSFDLSNHALILEALDRYPEAESLFQQALQMRERLFGRNHLATADVIHNLANLYAEQRNFDKAEQFHWEALSIRLDAETVDKEDVANSNHNLGNIYSIKDYGQAEKYYQQSLSMLEKELGPRHPDLATGLQNLGLLYESKGQYGKALASLLEALSIREEKLGPDHPNVAKTLVCVANFYKNQDSFGAAEPLYQRALAIYQKTLDPDHPDRVIILVSLASFYQYQKQYDRAEPLYKQARAIREKIVGPNHPKVAQILVSLALLYINQQRYDQATPLLRHALTIHEQTFGRNHPDVADTLYFLALLSFQRNDYQKAESLYSRSLRIFEKTFGRDHPDVARSLTALVRLYDIKQYYRQAVPHLERILAIYEKTLDPVHEDIINTLARLAQMYEAQGVKDTAIKYLKRAIALQKRSETDELNVIPYIKSLASIYIDNELYPKAEELYKQIVTICEKALVPDEQMIIDARIHLAECYVEQEKYAEAERHYRIASQRREALSGPNHSDTLDLIHNLAVTYLKLSNYEQAVAAFQRLLKAYKDVYGSKHIKVAHTNRSLGYIYYEIEENENALLCFQKALAIYEKDPQHGDSNPDTLDIIHKIATIYLNQSEYEQAAPPFQRVLKAYITIDGPDSIRVADVNRSLGYIYYELDRYDESAPYFQRSLAIYEKDPQYDELNIARVVFVLADIYRLQAQDDEAIPLLRRTLKLLQAGPDSDYPDMVTVLTMLADLYRRQEQYDQALPLYREALRVREADPASNDLNLFEILTKLAGLYVDQEEQETYRLAEPLYRRALQLFDTGITVEPIQIIIVLLTSLAFCCVQLRNYADGASFYKRALQICQTTSGMSATLQSQIKERLDGLRDYLP